MAKTLYVIADRNTSDNVWLVKASSRLSAWECFASSQEMSVLDAKRDYEMSAATWLEGR